MPTYEELLAAGAEPAEAPKGKGLTYEQLVAAGAEPAGGYDPRIAARGARPAPKSDDELGISGGPVTTAVPRNPLREAFPRATERSRREDPIGNDPLAGMIAQGILAHGAGALVGGVTGIPIAGQAAQGAVMDPEHPLEAAALSALPGVPGAIKQADRAVGSAALSRMNAGKTLVPAGRAAGTAAGTMAGHAAVPYVGAPIGAALGAKLGGAAGRTADRAVAALGRRHMMRTAAAAPPVAPDVLADILAQTEPAAARAPLAPLVHQPLPEPAIPPELLRGPPPASFDELTRPGQPVGNHATVGGGTVPNLRADVVRDAKRFAAEPPPAVRDVLGEQLAKSVQLLDELRAGKITAQQAIAAGLSPQVVAKVAH